MAYIALIEEKLRPALVIASVFHSCPDINTNLWQFLLVRVLLCNPQLHTFWVDAENYAHVTRPWFASRSPFPLNFLVPSRYAKTALSRILLTKGEAPLHRVTEVEGKVDIDLSDSSFICCVNMSVLCFSSQCIPFLLSVFRSTVMLKSVWIFSPTDLDQQTTSLAIRKLSKIYWVRWSFDVP